MSKKKSYFSATVFIIEQNGKQKCSIQISNMPTLSALKKAINGYAKRYGATMKKGKTKPFVRATLEKWTEEFNDGVYWKKIVGRINESGF